MHRFAYLLLLLLVNSSPSNAENIGLLIMATGKYIQFVKPLVESAEQHFCNNHHVTYFVFTDGVYEGEENVETIYQSRLGWPYDTMMRFQVYYNNRNRFQDQDYLFACDADMLFVGDIGEEIFSDRVAITHPGYYNKPRKAFTYETNPLSLACIKANEGDKYFCGGFYGGTKEEFLTMSKINSKKIDKDLRKGIVALWHDESHLNRYFIDHPPTLVLSPSYCFPEGWVLPFEPKLMALNKNHAEMRK